MDRCWVYKSVRKLVEKEYVYIEQISGISANLISISTKGAMVIKRVGKRFNQEISSRKRKNRQARDFLIS